VLKVFYFHPLDGSKNAVEKLLPSTYLILALVGLVWLKRSKAN